MSAMSLDDTPRHKLGNTRRSPHSPFPPEPDQHVLEQIQAALTGVAA